MTTVPWSEETAGCVITPDGPVWFDDWYTQKFGEEPSRANIRRRARVASVRSSCIQKPAHAGLEMGIGAMAKAIVKLSEQDVREIELMEQGVMPVREFEFDRVFTLIEELATFVELSFAPDGKLTGDDWAKFKGTWEAAMDLKANYKKIIAEWPELGPVAKLKLLARAAGTAAVVTKALKAIKGKIGVSAPVVPTVLVEDGNTIEATAADVALPGTEPEE